MSQSTPLTWDRWKQLLLPKGWYYYDGSLTSPASPCGVHCWIINHGADGLLFHIQKGAKYLTLEIPETPYQMMSLLHGLGIITEETFNGFQRSEQSAEPNEPTQSQQPNESTVSDASNESTQPCESDRVDTADR